jgi:serine/threonine-protein kinase
MHTDVDQLAAALRDRFVIERELGRGGMATVYRALDVRHDRAVALKVLDPELAAVLGAERFVREIKLTARLRHPHILPVFDSGEAAGRLWYVTPCIDGGSLRARLARESRLPVSDAVAIARDVLSGLGYAHAQGIVHRDIKPENILLDQGAALVADFGIATAVDAAGGDRLTATGLALGTVAYMSPEQAAAERHVDARSDLFSFGCVLYEMLAGEPPWTGSTPQSVLVKRVTAPAPDVRLLRPGLPAGLAAATARALALTPADRFGTAEEFADALSAAQAATTAPEAPPRPEAYTFRTATASGAVASAPEAAAMPSSKSRKRARAAGVIAAALVVLGGVIWTAGPRFLRPRLAPSPTRLAVLPFSVTGGSNAAYLRDGMVDLLSRNLDGAGELRTVDPVSAVNAARRAGDAAPDAERARELAGRLGAAAYVVGSVQTNGARLRIHAALHADTTGGQPSVAEATVEGDSTDLFALVDRLAAELLADRAAGPGFRLVRTAAMTTTSLPAIKSYLGAEAEFRAVRHDSAIAAFRRATDADTTFALAYYRQAVAGLWGNRPNVVEPALDRAVRLSARLGEHDRALVSALDAFRRGEVEEAERRYRAILREYPDDVEAASELAMLFFLYNPLRGESRAPAMAGFQRVAALDPKFFCPI